MLLGYSDSELANMGGYDLVHYDDLAYVASAHQERKLKTIVNKLSCFNTYIRSDANPLTLLVNRKRGKIRA